MILIEKDLRSRIISQFVFSLTFLEINWPYWVIGLTVTVNIPYMMMPKIPLFFLLFFEAELKISVLIVFKSGIQIPIKKHQIA